jgi:ubiquitin carboxyl-terminal hydrolase 34
MYGYLEISEKHAYDPTEFCFTFKDFDGNPTNTALQQDA